MKIKMTLVTLMAVLCLGGCKTSYKEATIASLNGRWEIVQIYKENLPESLEKKPVLEFNVSEKMVYGNSGCNTVRGSYTQTMNKANSLVFGQMASTMMMCQETEMKVERSVLDAMQKVVSFAKQGDFEIVLLDKDGKPALTIKK